MLAHEKVPAPSALGETGMEADRYDRSCPLVIAPPPLSLPGVPAATGEMR